MEDILCKNKIEVSWVRWVPWYKSVGSIMNKELARFLYSLQNKISQLRTLISCHPSSWFSSIHHNLPYSGKLALLAILVSGGIVLQVLACALYNNWWPMLTALMYVIIPVPLIVFAGSDTSALFTTSENSWVDATKFLTGASALSSFAIPIILKHAGIITWGAFAMELSSLVVFATAIFYFIGMNSDDGGGYNSI